MPVKFKLGFTIDSETLFGILSKVLPIEDLSVEEVIEHPKSDPAIRFDKRFDLPKPQRAKRGRGKGGGYAMNLHAGVNACIMQVFADGQPHGAGECKPPVMAAGYSINGIGSRLERLKIYGVAHQPEPGMWQLTPKGKAAWAAGADVRA